MLYLLMVKIKITRRIAAILLIGIMTLFMKCTCETSYQQQFEDCFETYQVGLETCQADEACELNVIENFQECIGFQYTFPVHFTVFTDKLAGTSDSVNEECKAVIDTLNKYFTVEDASLPPDNRRRVVTFTFKSVTYYADAVGFSGDMVDQAADEFIFEDRHSFKAKVNAETNPALKDDNAINVFVVDMKKQDSAGTSIETSDSHAKNNSNHPYIVIDYARMNGQANRVGAEEHEMGHCFNLAHVCQPGASGSSSTNIMSSSGTYPTNNNFEYISGDPQSTCGSGSAGTRAVGFNTQQCQIILAAAEDIKNELGL